ELPVHPLVTLGDGAGVQPRRDSDPLPARVREAHNSVPEAAAEHGHLHNQLTISPRPPRRPINLAAAAVHPLRRSAPRHHLQGHVLQLLLLEIDHHSSPALARISRLIVPAPSVLPPSTA